MKNYLLLFLCFAFVIFSAPLMYSLMPDELKPISSVSYGTSEESHTEKDGNDGILLFDTEADKKTLLSVEEYTSCLLAGECPESMEFECLKVIADVMRTYAVKNKGKHKSYDFCTDKACCRKVDMHPKAVFVSAVKATEGEIIMYNGKPIEPVMHIASYGKTEDAFNVFGKDFPYLVSTETPDESSVSGFTTKKEFSSKEFSDILIKNGYDIDVNTNHKSWVTYTSYTESERMKTVYIGQYGISGEEFRKMFGLSSCSITVTAGDGGFVLVSRGIGHGVGLSECGAWLMAKDGKCHVEIIVHYYSGAYVALN